MYKIGDWVEIRGWAGEKAYKIKCIYNAGAANNYSDYGIETEIGFCELCEIIKKVEFNYLEEIAI